MALDLSGVPEIKHKQVIEIVKWEIRLDDVQSYAELVGIDAEGSEYHLQYFDEVNCRPRNLDIICTDHRALEHGEKEESQTATQAKG